MASINLQSKDGGDDGSRSPARSLGVSSPWSKIVRGDSGELSPPVVSMAVQASPSSSSVQEQIVNPSSDCYPPKAALETASSPDDSGTQCQPEGSDNGGGGSNAVKKPVWSKPSNGVVEVVNPVMDAVSWPALGEIAKSSGKSSSSESLPALSDGSSMPALQVTGNPSPSHKLASGNNVNPTSTPNHEAPSGHRSLRRGGGISGTYLSSNGGVSQRPQASHDSKVEAPHNSSVAMDTYPKDHTQKGGFRSQSNSGNDHNFHRNSYRRGQQYPRGDGSYNHNYGNKPDQGRGNHEWNQHRNFNNNMQAHTGFSRGFIRPSVHTSAPLIPPPMPMPVPMPMPMRPFGNNVMYPAADMVSGMVYLQGPPPIAPPPMYFPMLDPLVHSMLVNQINYYFSNENLVKDTYLREKMDEQGWVSVNLIAGFKKVSSITGNIPLILDAMRTSALVEVKGDKMRRRNEWEKWLLPASVVDKSKSVNQDALAAQLQGVVFEEGSTSTSSSSRSEGARVA